MSACANRTTDHTARPVVPGEPGHRTTNQRETVWVSSQAEAQGCSTVMSRPRRLVDAPTGRHSYTLHAGTVHLKSAAERRVRQTCYMEVGDENPIPSTIQWCDGVVRLIDQRRLPEELVFFDATTVDELCEAIRTLAVRGAPALGAAGAMGVALAASRGEDLVEAAARIVATRPTAVNLRWGVERALAAFDPVAEAIAVASEDAERNRRLGRLGAELVPGDARVLTHCNAGSLACVEYGTALGVIRAASRRRGR